MSPAQTLSRLLRRLRVRFLARRAIEILAIALVLDLLLDAASVGFFFLFRTPIRTQFFLEAFLLLLIVQTAIRYREPSFAGFLDRSFRLRDRLYSHLQYRKDPAVPEMLREAQAMECLRSIDLAAISRRVGPRFPRSLFLTLPLFAGLTFYYMDLPYSPPGPIGRAVVSILGSQQGARPSAPSGPAAADETPASDEKAPASSVDSVAGASNGTEREASPAAPATAELDERNGKDAVGPERRGLSAEDPPATPRSIESFPVTEEVSPVVPPVLADESTDLNATGYDPKRLLGLIPWPEAETPDLDLTQLARDVPTPSTAGYPVAYRNHIDRYFQELLAWQTR